MDSEFVWRKPTKRSHGEVVGAAVVGSELSGEVLQRVKAAAGIEAFLILAVTTLHFTVVAGRVGADELVTDTQLGGSDLKQSSEIPLAVGKTVGEFKAVIRLDAFHMDSPAGMSLEQLFQEICGEIGGLFRVGGQKRRRVNSSIAVYWYKHSSWPAMQRRGPLSHLPGYAVRDRSSAGRAWVYKLVSSLSTGTDPAFS